MPVWWYCQDAPPHSGDQQSDFQFSWNDGTVGKPKPVVWQLTKCIVALSALLITSVTAPSGVCIGTSSWKHPGLARDALRSCGRRFSARGTPLIVATSAGVNSA